MKVRAADLKEFLVSLKVKVRGEGIQEKRGEEGRWVHWERDFARPNPPPICPLCLLTTIAAQASQGRNGSTDRGPLLSPLANSIEK
jgi:hypothetical protein